MSSIILGFVLEEDKWLPVAMQASWRLGIDVLHKRSYL